MQYFNTFFAAAGLLATSAYAAPTATNPCAAIASGVKAGQGTFDAQQAADCLKSVPFDAKAASQFISLYNTTTLQFQTTPAYLKDPPKSYQQPAADLDGGLTAIQAKVDNGSYTNEYDFEADMQNLLQSAHDGHLSLKTGALSVFLFTPPMQLTSLSEDGQKTPLVYPADDVIAAVKQGKDFSGSALTQINGMNTTTYLQNWAARFQNGFSEPHADWNGLMSNAAEFLAGQASGWNGSFVFSDEFMNVTFANGSTNSLTWTARIFPSQAKLMAQVTDGQTFYEAFVALPTASTTGGDGGTGTGTGSDLLALNAAYAKNAAEDASSMRPAGATASLTQWPLAAYPSPVLAQADLQEPVLGGMASLTGYMVGDLAVLSIPSFEGSAAGAQAFSKTVADFITMAQKANAKNVLFDVQGNGGGDPMMAYEVYKQFFPAANPFSGARARDHAVANALGTAFSDSTSSSSSNSNGDGTASQQQQQPTEADLDAFLQSPAGGASPWLAQLYNDAVNTSHQFSSWQDWAPPVADRGDTFTQAFVDDFNRSLFDLALSGDGGANGIVLDGFGNRSEAGTKQPFATADMAILADGICTSTCTVFVELMHHQAGVRAVAAGGLPVTGPMQMATGARGAQSYEMPQILRDIETAAKARPDLVAGGGSTAAAMTTRTTSGNGSNRNGNDSGNVGSSNSGGGSATGAAAALPLPAIQQYAGIQWLESSVNLWDQIRVDASTHGQPSIPLQFTYQPADCRIFYTAQTFNNYTALWTYAASAIFDPGSGKCVPGSTGQPAASPNVTDASDGPTVTGTATPGQFDSSSGSGSASSSSSSPSASGSGSAAAAAAAASKDKKSAAAPAAKPPASIVAALLPALLAIGGITFL